MALVINDNKDVCSLMGHLLESLDCAALAMCKGCRMFNPVAGFTSINQVVVDFYMPDMEGWTCFQKIRTTHPSFPVVFCSGYYYADHPDLKPLAPIR